MKKMLLVMAMAIALVLSTMAGAFADQHVGGNNGIECTLADGTTYDNPGDMLKFLRERDDGHFRNTVAWYDFDSVGDLILQKCDVG